MHRASQYGHADADHAAVARMLLEAGAKPEPEHDTAPEHVRAVIRAFAGGSITG